MLFLNKLIKITVNILFVIVLMFFSTLQSKNLDKYNNADSIADYFSGILLLNQSKYHDSYKFFKKLDGLQKSHSNYSSKYLYSLINSGNFNQAFIFSKKLEKENQGSFESDLIMGIYFLKNSKYRLSSEYFLRAKNRKFRTVLDNYIANTLYIWSDLENYNIDIAKIKINELDGRFENLKKIQNVFLNCFFDSNDTPAFFNELVSDKKTDFSRYNYFFAKYLLSIGESEQAKKIVISSLQKYPRNLLLNQMKINLQNSKNKFDFDCKKKKDVVAEMLYIAANALSTQSIYPLSNFYLNLSKFLNKDFSTFDTLSAENFYNIDDFVSAKEIYGKLVNNGVAFKWYSNKQISRILIKEGKIEESLDLIKNSYDSLPIKGIYDTYDYAEFLKNNEKFEKSIKYYSEILEQINENHPLYPEVTNGRGVAYERIGEWEKAEKDLLASLKASPDQAYVINYLAYSWIEQGIKIEKSLAMLEKANKLRSNDPYIIDSLGWALFKLKKYKESKKYLQLAVRLMPADPTVNDHYGDVLWKNGNELQARYYWNYVLDLKDAEEDLKQKIKHKLIKGI